jgi:hypothetical protein
MPSSFKNQTITTTKRETKMKKTLLALLSIGIAFTAIQPAQAQDQKVIAIIDTAIDSKKVPSVIYEACFTENKSCPNKTNFMEGTGSANSSVWPTSMISDVYHGHNVTQVALSVDPTAKIVFVRIANITAAGNSTNTPGALNLAIDWVSKNAEKYSIDAVSISQSSISTNNLSACTTNTTVISAVSSLNAKNIPVFAATGNDRSTSVVGYPACIHGVIGVGAVVPALNLIAPSTNTGPGLDVLAVGTVDVVRYNGTVATISGTSVASPRAASLYVKNNTSGLQNFISSLNKFLAFPLIN